MLEERRDRPDQAAGPASSRSTDENFEPRYKFFYDRAGADAGAVPGAGRRHADDQGVHPSGYVQVGERARSTAPSVQRASRSRRWPGASSLMDLMSFRDLYGYLTNDNAEELKQIKPQSGREGDRARERRGRAVRRDAATRRRRRGDRRASSTRTKSCRAPRRSCARRTSFAASTPSRRSSGGVVLNARGDPQGRDEAVDADDRRDRDGCRDQDDLNIKAIRWQQAAGSLGPVRRLVARLLLVLRRC